LLLAEQLPFLQPRDFARRVDHLGGMFFNALIERDNLAAAGKPVSAEALFYDELFAMMTAAVSVPFTGK
jgi:hypothetical protein